MLFLKIKLLKGEMCANKESMGPARDSHDELCRLDTFPRYLQLPWEVSALPGPGLFRKVFPPLPSQDDNTGQHCQ